MLSIKRLFYLNFILCAALAAHFFYSDFYNDPAYGWLIVPSLVVLVGFAGYVFINPHRRRYAVHTTIYELRQLNKAIFSCLLNPEYSDYVYLFERKLHVHKRKFLHALVELRQVAKEEVEIDPLLARLERLFENMLDYAQVRRRVSDHSTFSLSAPELQLAMDAIDSLLMKLSRQPLQAVNPDDKQALSQAIDRLQESYHSIWQVTAREPLVFLLFISSLQDFSNALS